MWRTSADSSPVLKSRAAALVVATIVATAISLLPASVAAGPHGQPDGCGSGPTGENKVYLGAWIPAAYDDPRVSRGADPLGQFESKAGKGVSILQRWEHWGLGPGGRIDIKWLRRVAEGGAYPMITWVPWNPELPNPGDQAGFLMRDVASGAHDGYIADIASEVAEWDGPIFIRFAQEMNGTWYPWGKHQNAPEEYISAWRRIHRIFGERGAGHVTWVWNVSEKNHPESLRLWYPGDDVVDWVAVDGYNWDAPQYWREDGDTWRLLDRVFRPSFENIGTFVPSDKPRMIAETSTNERGGDPGKKSAWICDAFGRALPEALPEIKAVMWFDEPTNEGGWIVPWPIDSTEESLAAFRAAVSPPYYVGSLGDAPMKLGRQKIPPP
ncbi:MAG TPA: glycosyl hydrolase [Chloroflexota bacterium]|nr:glycosyl hydrolase [Chloroflexota bacterium]